MSEEDKNKTAAEGNKSAVEKDAKKNETKAKVEDNKADDKKDEEPKETAAQRRRREADEKKLEEVVSQPLDDVIREEHEKLPAKDESISVQETANAGRRDVDVEGKASLAREYTGDVNGAKVDPTKGPEGFGQTPEGDVTNLFGDNSRQEPVEDENLDPTRGTTLRQVSEHANPYGDNSRMEPAYYERVGLDEEGALTAKDLPEGTPDFVREYAQKDPAHAAQVFNTILGMRRRAWIDNISLAGYADLSDPAGFEASFRNLTAQSGEFRGKTGPNESMPVRQAELQANRIVKGTDEDDQAAKKARDRAVDKHGEEVEANRT